MIFKSDAPLPGLKPLAQPAAPEVEVSLTGFPSWLARLLESPQSLWYVSDHGEAGKPNLKIWRTPEEGYFRISYKDGVEFVSDCRGARVWARWPAKADLDYVSTYLLGPVLGFILMLREVLCLHGSAVAVGAQALAILGPPGAGKSTTAAAFARQGFPILTDDIVALKEEGGEFLAMPGDPNLCLWPQSVAMLFGSPEALPPVIPENLLEPEWDKRCLDLHAPGFFFQSQPLPLKAIYLLGGRDNEAGPRVGPLSWREGFLELLANAYVTKLLDAPRRAAEFDALGSLMARVPVRRVIPRAGGAFLSELCAEILQDFYSLLAYPTSPSTSELRENHGI